MPFWMNPMSSFHHGSDSQTSLPMQGCQLPLWGKPCSELLLLSCTPGAHSSAWAAGHWCCSPSISCSGAAAGVKQPQAGADVGPERHKEGL